MTPKRYQSTLDGYLARATDFFVLYSAGAVTPAVAMAEFEKSGQVPPRCSDPELLRQLIFGKALSK